MNRHIFTSLKLYPISILLSKQNCNLNGFRLCGIIRFPIVYHREFCSNFLLRSSLFSNFQNVFHDSSLNNSAIQKNQVRTFWAWLNMVFNRVDESRIKDAGPDRACAEWLVRCGASVRWVNSEHWTDDYNSLQLLSGRRFIEQVDGTDSAIMYIGFPYFRGCKYIKKMVLHKAIYIDDEALKNLNLLRNSLLDLQVSSCGNVSIDGLRELKKLKNLKKLFLYDFPYLKDKDSLLNELKEALPNCEIEFPYA